MARVDAAPGIERCCGPGNQEDARRRAVTPAGSHQFGVVGQADRRPAAARVPKQRQPAKVGAAGQIDAKAVGAAGRGLGQALQVQVEHLRQPLVGRGLAEAEGVLGVEVGGQDDVTLGRQRVLAR